MILVTGAKGVVGTPLCDALAEQNRDYLAVSRSAGTQLFKWDMLHALGAEQQSQLSQITTLIHCAPIWLLPKHMPALAQVNLKRVIVFSSTSVLSKQDSPDTEERKLVQSLADAERELVEHCAALNINLTIFRPSLIYGYGRDQNISHLARFISKWKVMFLVGRATGKRQPVHADDLVSACINAENELKTFGQTYNLAGGEVLTYRQMVQRIFAGLNQKTIIVSLPLRPFRWFLKTASVLGRFNYTADMADRMNQDLDYDIVSANVDFGFQPQAFLEQPQRDLVNL